MYRGRSNRIIPIILVLIVVAIIVAALVSVGRMIFGGGSATDPVQTDAGQQALLNTSSDHSVQMTVRGPIVANENFRSYRITVDPNSRNLTTYSGYLHQPIDSRTLGNNTEAYEQFVYALDKANMMNGEPFNDERGDTRGICASGNVYEFEVMAAGETVEHLWTSTCSGSPGSFEASVEQVGELFLAQIPDNDELLDEIDL